MTKLNEKDLTEVSGGSSSDIEFDGEISKAKPNSEFEVNLENGSVIVAFLSGPIKMEYLGKTLEKGTKVRVTYDPARDMKGKIIRVY